MSSNFDWEFDEEYEFVDGDVASSQRERPRWRMWLFPLVLVGVLVGVGGWFWVRIQQTTNETLTMAQAVLDAQQSALALSDGEKYLSLFDGSQQYTTAQWRPELQGAVKRGLTAETVQFNQSEIWVNASWEEEGTTYQRLLFFKRDNAPDSLGLIQTADSSRFWGDKKVSQHPWGTLTLYDADTLWSPQFEKLMENRWLQSCLSSSSDNTDCEKPLSLTIDNAFSQFETEGEIRLPSPRLIGLNESGDPAPSYWQMVSARLTETPTTITFVIPSKPSTLVGEYQRAADRFMEENPGIKIALIPWETFTNETDALKEVDGATLMPTEALIMQGYIRDVTDFLLEGNRYKIDPYYPQMIAGVEWENRLWGLPHSAELSLLFIDQSTQAELNIDNPSLAEINRFLQTNADSRLLVSTRDFFFASAYANQTESSPLTHTEVDQTFAHWHESGISNHTLTLADSDDTIRNRSYLNAVSSNRQVDFWLDNPGQYEYHIQLNTLTVHRFPSIDETSAVTPLWLNTSVISAYSDAPRATWQWIEFLTENPPGHALRHIPSHRRIADTHFWTSLPRALDAPMSQSFANTRAVSIADQDAFNWFQLAKLAVIPTPNCTPPINCPDTYYPEPP